MFRLGVDESREVDDGQMWALRARDLDAEDIVREGLAVRRDAHCLLGLLYDVGQVSKPRQLFFEAAQGSDLCLWTRLVGNDGDAGTVYLISPQNQFGRETGTEVAFDGEGDSGYCFQDRALSG